jgi:predicted DsbA family dithiol-disulfide isomerase
MPPEYRARIDAGQPRLEAIARQQYGLELNRGPLGIDSRAALIGEKVANAHGLGKAYHDAVFAAYWQHATAIDDRDTLADIAVSVGMDREAFVNGLDDPAYEREVEQDIAFAHANGMTGVPALVFADKYLVMGAQRYPVLEQVLQQVENA